MDEREQTAKKAVERRVTERLPLLVKRSDVRCGQANEILSPDLKRWFLFCLGCVAGRREFMSSRYFAVEARTQSDVIAGWRRFMKALEARETVACIYVFPDLLRDAQTQLAQADHPRIDARAALARVCEIMSPLSDQSAETLLNGGVLNAVLMLTCPITSCRAAYFDFDAVAFVPQADDKEDPLYDPLMAAPVPMVNINSDVYGFSMFTRDHVISKFECEVQQLTKRERRYVFGEAADMWQRMAEKTITNYAQVVDQQLCPTFLTRWREQWVANHKDPVFAETEKRPYTHEMPVGYTRRIVAVWNAYFEQGVPPDYRDIATEGTEVQCPIGPAAGEGASGEACNGRQ
jgi:hypothetical protein